MIRPEIAHESRRLRTHQTKLLERRSGREKSRCRSRRHAATRGGGMVREALHLALDGLDLLAATSAFGLRDGGMEVLEEGEEVLDDEGVEEFLCDDRSVAVLNRDLAGM